MLLLKNVHKRQGPRCLSYEMENRVLVLCSLLIVILGLSSIIRIRTARTHRATIRTNEMVIAPDGKVLIDGPQAGANFKVTLSGNASIAATNQSPILTK